MVLFGTFGLLHCFAFLAFTLFCGEFTFDAIYTLFYVKLFWQKLSFCNFFCLFPCLHATNGCVNIFKKLTIKYYLYSYLFYFSVINKQIAFCILAYSQIVRRRQKLSLFMSVRTLHTHSNCPCVLTRILSSQTYAC